MHTVFVVLRTKSNRLQHFSNLLINICSECQEGASKIISSA